MNLVILASGSGTTFEAVANAQIDNLKILALIVDRECGAIGRADNLNMRCFHINYKSDPTSFTRRLVQHLEDLNPDYILLSGFLRKIPVEVIQRFKGRIFNSHPALLPRHGGAGLYGRKVHEAVINAKDTETGITFHHVTENYDEGPSIAQRRVPVSANDTAETLEDKVKVIEKEFIIEQLRKLSR